MCLVCMSLWSQKGTDGQGLEVLQYHTALCCEPDYCNRDWPLKPEVTDKAGSVSHLATRTSCVTHFQRDSSQAVFGWLIVPAD